MKTLLFLASIIVFTACTKERVQPETKWDVKVTKESEQKVWVWKNDGSKQCDGPALVTPLQMAKKFKESGIPVFQYRRGNDGMMYPTVCGGATGQTIELEISKLDVPKALQLGFKSKSQ